jgi:mRNA-degrading endonuclease RelE of RelBE toxin-antitoxin system
MKFEVEYSNDFEKKFKKLSKKYKSLKSEVFSLIERLQFDPKQGTPIGNDCYKIRFSIFSKGKGKSGGGRIITQVYVFGQKVYLLSIYYKSDKENITDSELKTILKKLKN